MHLSQLLWIFLQSRQRMKTQDKNKQLSLALKKNLKKRKLFKKKLKKNR